MDASIEKKGMSRTQQIRIAVDFSMVILLPLLMSYSLLGEAAHEWLGTVMTALFILHHILNRKWYGSLFKGRYSGVRVLGILTDFLLLADMIALPVSGILMSRHVFAFLEVVSGIALARTIHLLASYWGLILMSFHAGLHGGAIMGMLRKAANIKSKSAARTIILRVIAALLGIWGILIFIRREIGSYLLLRNQFVFFDFSQPLIYFVLDYVAVMALFAMAGYYSAKLLKRQNL